MSATRPLCQTKRRVLTAFPVSPGTRVKRSPESRPGASGRQHPHGLLQRLVPDLMVQHEAHRVRPQRARQHAPLCPARDLGGGDWSLQPGTFGAYVVVDDVDGLYERIRASGATLADRPTDTDYGSREFQLRDPEGNRWSFGTYRGEPRRPPRTAAAQYV